MSIYLLLLYFTSILPLSFTKNGPSDVEPSDVDPVLNSSTLAEKCVFSCVGRVIGYYADIPSGCAGVWHCAHNHQTGTIRYRYGACLNDTVYDQSQLKCVPKNETKVRCAESPKYFAVKEQDKLAESDESESESDPKE